MQDLLANFDSMAGNFTLLTNGKFKLRKLGNMKTFDVVWWHILAVATTHVPLDGQDVQQVRMHFALNFYHVVADQ